MSLTGGRADHSDPDMLSLRRVQRLAFGGPPQTTRCLWEERHGKLRQALHFYPRRMTSDRDEVGTELPACCSLWPKASSNCSHPDGASPQDSSQRWMCNMLLCLAINYYTSIPKLGLFVNFALRDASPRTRLLISPNPVHAGFARDTCTFGATEVSFCSRYSGSRGPLSMSRLCTAITSLIQLKLWLIYWREMNF